MWSCLVWRNIVVVTESVVARRELSQSSRVQSQHCTRTLRQQILTNTCPFSGRRGRIVVQLQVRSDVDFRCDDATRRKRLIDHQLEVNASGFVVAVVNDAFEPDLAGDLRKETFGN